MTAFFFIAECGMTNGVAARQPRMLMDSSFDDISVDYEERSELSSVNKTNQAPRLINGKESQRGAWPWQVVIKFIRNLCLGKKKLYKRKSFVK